MCWDTAHNNARRDGKWRKIKVNVVQAAGDARVQTHYKKGYVAALDKVGATFPTFSFGRTEQG